MSRIGRMPIELPAGVEVKIGDNNVVTVKGPKGTLTQQLHPAMSFNQEGNVIHVTRPNDLKENRALHGLTRSLLHNMVVGVTEGFKKELEINGIGYRAAKQGKQVVLNVGFSHQVFVDEIEASPSTCPSPTRSWSPAATSRRWASSPLRCVPSVPPSLTRARASSMLTRSSAARKVRPVRAARSN